MSGPLSHIRVLDLSRVLAGPWAGQTLADLGAEVIKVERPGAGDDTRGWGPPFLTDREGTPTTDAAYFLSANRGKKSVTIDFTRPEGRDLVYQLAAESDIVLENFKVGGLARYGLDYASLSAVNPRLIYCSITGFGQTGPDCQRAGYDFLIQGMGGLMSVTGEPDGTPGGGPIKVGVAIVDIFTGMYASTAVLAALAHRERTGEGQHIDLALLDVQVATLANQAMNYLISGQSPSRLGNAHPNIVPYQACPTADGHIILAVGNDLQFRKFCQVAARPELADDPRFATNAARVNHRAELMSHPRTGHEKPSECRVDQPIGSGRGPLRSDPHPGRSLRPSPGRGPANADRAGPSAGRPGPPGGQPDEVLPDPGGLPAGAAGSG